MKARINSHLRISRKQLEILDESFPAIKEIFGAVLDGFILELIHVTYEHAAFVAEHIAAFISF